VTDTIAKEPSQSYRVVKPNFEQVAPGEVLTRVEGEPLRADRESWPDLMSAEGHVTLFGYEAREAGPIGDGSPKRETG
jgi:hypothetical protein